MYLLANENQLTSLDISNNTLLKYLWCNYNQLTSLDLSRCPDSFMSLDCRNNQIGGPLDVSRFADLYQLAISNNEFTQLILSDHPQLNLIYCEYNQISNPINVTGCPVLEVLYAHYNQLPSLDVSGLPKLQGVRAEANLLTSIRAENCPVLYVVSITLNQLKTAQMGQLVNDLTTWTAENMGNLYVLNHDKNGYVEGNVITVDQVNQAMAKYWNVYQANAEGTEWEPCVGSNVLRGDVNGDGDVNIVDATTLIDYLLIGDASAVNLDNADVNGDSEVTIADVTALIDTLLSGSATITSPAAGAVSGRGILSLPDKELILEKPQRQRPSL
jgi:hypothetical protein